MPIIRFTVVAFLLLAAPAIAASDPQFSVGLGIDYGKGNFKTGYTSTYMAVPLIVDWVPNARFNLELNVPYVKQTSSQPDKAVTAPMVTGSMGTSNMGAGNMAINGGTTSNTVTGGTRTVAAAGQPGMMGGAGSEAKLLNGVNQSGLGDITLTGAYNLVLDGEGSLNLGVTGYVKFPTADKDKGLGTGAFDWGPGLLLAKRFGIWQPFAEGRYVIQGNSRPEIGARNYFLADAGLGYDWRENLSSTLFCRVGTAAFAGMAAPLEMRLKTVWGFRENTSVELDLLKGLSAGSPDLGGGISFLVAF